MTPIAATLDVNFVSNFAGQHRICYRIVPSLVYDCTTVVTCLGGGNTCTASIPILVDNNTCVPVTYEGYVQAECESEESLVGRIPFYISFIPNPICDSYTVTCITTGVDSILSDIVGAGYDPLVPPTALLTLGGGGVGAVATVFIGNGVSVSPHGTLYADGTYTLVPLINIIGAGIGALATVVIFAGEVTGATITTTGTDYLPLDTFGFNSAYIGRTGSGAVGTFSSVYGTVTGVGVTPGSGFTLVPIVTIDPPPGTLGTLATAHAILELCPDQILGSDCGGGDPATITGMAIGQHINACMTDLPVVLPEYTFVKAGCCFDCLEVTFTAVLDPVTITWTTCGGEQGSLLLNPGDSHGPICVVNNSWFTLPATTDIIITTGVSCVIPPLG